MDPEYLFGWRVFQACIYTLLTIMIYRRHHTSPFHLRPLLYRLFVIANCAWTVYMWLDAIIFSYAALSMSPSLDLIKSGYDLGYPSLWIANFLRDLAMVGLLVEAFALILIGPVIQYGDLRALKKFHSPWIILIAIVIGLVIIWNDTIAVEVRNGVIRIMAQASVGLVIVLFLYLGAYLGIRQALTKIDHNQMFIDQRLEIIARIRLLEWSVFLKCFSIIWIIIWTIVAVFLPSEYVMDADSILYWMVFLVKQLLWIGSPVLMLYAVRKMKV